MECDEEERKADTEKVNNGSCALKQGTNESAIRNAGILSPVRSPIKAIKTHRGPKSRKVIKITEELKKIKAAAKGEGVEMDKKRRNSRR